MFRQKPKTSLRGFLHALSVAVYVFLVAIIMNNGEQIFGKEDKLVGTIAFLLLFVLSASVVGGLVFAKPVMMYLDGEKKEALNMLLHTIAWLFIILALILAVMVLI